MATFGPALVKRASMATDNKGKAQGGHLCFETVEVSGIRQGHIRYSDIRATRPIADQYRGARDATLAISGVARA